jgi:hypothetical protein
MAYRCIGITLVLGFDRQHRASGERFLPAGTIMQGLAEEPHYGRAIGETIFEIDPLAPDGNGELAQRRLRE